MDAPQTLTQQTQQEPIAASGATLIDGSLTHPKIDTPGRRTWRRFKKHRLAVAGSIFV